MDIISEVEKKVYSLCDFKEEWISKKLDEDAILWSAVFGHHLRSPFIFILDKDTGTKTKTKKSFRGQLSNEDKKVPEFKSNQLRKFFGALREFENKLEKPNVKATYEEKKKMFPKTEFMLMLPKIAYAVGRESKEEAKIKDFFEAINKQMQLVVDYDSFMNMMKLLESTVAFHKYYGGE